MKLELLTGMEQRLGRKLCFLHLALRCFVNQAEECLGFTARAEDNGERFYLECVI